LEGTIVAGGMQCVQTLQAVVERNLRFFRAPWRLLTEPPAEGTVSFYTKRFDSNGKLPLLGSPSDAAERRQQQGRERPRKNGRHGHLGGAALADMGAPLTQPLSPSRPAPNRAATRQLQPQLAPAPLVILSSSKRYLGCGPLTQ
jgi:hypothetical protein